MVGADSILRMISTRKFAIVIVALITVTAESPALARTALIQPAADIKNSFCAREPVDKIVRALAPRRNRFQRV